jgi:transcriptional regulator with XRE-family HTH domain
MKRTAQAVGQEVRKRRKFLRLNVKELSTRGGISHTTWYAVENGEDVSDDSYLGVCRALNWSDDSIGRLFAGQDPIEQDRSDTWAKPSYEGELLDAVRRLTEAVEQLTDRLPPPAP